MELGKYLELIRIKHWIKNLLIFAPLFFSLQINEKNIIDCFIAFFAFSFMASSVYIRNDIADIKFDASHVQKRNRPMASGRIDITNAWIIFFILFIFSTLISIWLSSNLFYVIGLYFVLNLLYSNGLKNIPIIDVMIVATGFVLRILAGAAVISVAVSQWIILCTFFGALFLGFSKRKSEINNLKENDYGSRSVLSFYEHNFINQLIGTTSGITIMCYALYTIDASTIGHFKTKGLIYTIPFVVFGIFRYFQIVYVKSSGEDPTKIFLTDAPIFLDVLLWIFFFSAIIYLS